MKGIKKSYNVFQVASAIIMILALLWLTVSAPFVYASQQELAKHHKAMNASADLSGEEEAGNSLTNTTEEKKPVSGSSVTEEYLHNYQSEDLILSIIANAHWWENSKVYTAFHGEVQVPPPNRA